MLVSPHLFFLIQSKTTALSDGAAHILGKSFSPQLNVSGKILLDRGRVWFQGDSKPSQVYNDA